VLLIYIHSVVIHNVVDSNNIMQVEIVVKDNKLRLSTYVIDRVALLLKIGYGNR